MLGHQIGLYKQFLKSGTFELLPALFNIRQKTVPDVFGNAVLKSYLRWDAKPWESPLLTLKGNISLPRLGWLLIMESLILLFEHPLKLNKKYLYVFTVILCFENAYPHIVFFNFIFLTACSSGHIYSHIYV